MSDNVVTFRGNELNGNSEPETDPSEYILICTECSCTTFQVQLNGTIVCANCDDEIPEEAHKLKVTSLVVEKDPVEESGHMQKISRYQEADMDLARARTVKRINEFNKENTLLVAVGYSTDGGAVQWAGVETSKEREWLKNKLVEMADWLDKFEMDDSKPPRSFVDDE